MDDFLKKFDARSRWKLSQQSMEGVVELFLRLDGSPTDKQRQALQSVGCEITSVIGDIATASVDSARLGELAKLPFVKRIELPRDFSSEAN